MTKYQKSTFKIIGKLKKIILKKNKIKYLKLVNSSGDKYWIKVSSDLRKSLDSQPNKGSILELAGKQKQNFKTNKIKYKAYSLKVIEEASETATSKVKEKEVSLLPVFDTQKKSKAKVLICQKSNCWKKGGKQVYDKLETSLSDRDLSDRIPIKKTGCLKKCKQAPNIVMLPDKARYSKVKTKQIPDLIEKHLVNG